MTIQMLSQVNPKIYAIIRQYIEKTIDELTFISIISKKYDKIIDKNILEMLKQIEKQWTTQKTMD